MKRGEGGSGTKAELISGGFSVVSCIVVDNV